MPATVSHHESVAIFGQALEGRDGYAPCYACGRAWVILNVSLRREKSNPNTAKNMGRLKTCGKCFYAVWYKRSP
jgi:hypothetical protein